MRLYVPDESMGVGHWVVKNRWVLLDRDTVQELWRKSEKGLNNKAL